MIRNSRNRRASTLELMYMFQLETLGSSLSCQASVQGSSLNLLGGTFSIDKHYSIFIALCLHCFALRLQESFKWEGSQITKKNDFGVFSET